MSIKSFQGVPCPLEKKPSISLLVSDYMTQRLITFSPKQSILQVMELFIKHRITGGPVVDDTGKLVGMISEGDCMKQISESRYFNMPILNKNVAHFMTTPVDTIPDTKTIFDAALYFDKTGRRRLPVLKNDLLVGQISRKDIVKAALKLRSQRWR